jgi:acetyltransferase-like isoleucine patch superfamily enzyme
MTAPVLHYDWFDRPVPENVEIGERSWLHSSYAFLHNQCRRPRGVRIGRDSGIYNGTFFDLGPEAEVEIGDFCTIVGAIIATNRRIVIHDFVFISHEVVIADSPWGVPERLLPDQSLSETPGPLEESVVIGENAWIGMRAVLLGGTRIGEGAIVGAGAVVNFAVPDFAIAAGNPARIVGTIRRG